MLSLSSMIWTSHFRSSLYRPFKSTPAQLSSSLKYWRLSQDGNSQQTELKMANSQDQPNLLPSMPSMPSMSDFFASDTWGQKRTCTWNSRWIVSRKHKSKEQQRLWSDLSTIPCLAAQCRSPNFLPPADRVYKSQNIDCETWIVPGPMENHAMNPEQHNNI
jgi:hypothetical protein